MIAMKCRRCGSENIRKNGRTPAGRQKIHCKNCRFYTNSPLNIYLYHYLKHLQRFRFISEFRTEKLCVTLRKLCVTLRLKSARQNYQNVLSIGI